MPDRCQTSIEQGDRLMDRRGNAVVDSRCWACRGPYWYWHSMRLPLPLALNTRVPVMDRVTLHSLADAATSSRPPTLPADPQYRQQPQSCPAANPHPKPNAEARSNAKPPALRPGSCAPPAARQDPRPERRHRPGGFRSRRLHRPGTVLPYRIDFENDPTATAPAQRVVVTDQLDPNIDWSTFQLTEVGFGDTIITIPAGSQHFQTTVPMTYNGQTFDVQIELG